MPSVFPLFSYFIFSVWFISFACISLCLSLFPYTFPPIHFSFPVHLSLLTSFLLPRIFRLVHLFCLHLSLLTSHPLFIFLSAHLLSQPSGWLLFHHIRLFSWRLLSTSCFVLFPPPAHLLCQHSSFYYLRGIPLVFALCFSLAFPAGSFLLPRPSLPVSPSSSLHFPAGSSFIATIWLLYRCPVISSRFSFYSTSKLYSEFTLPAYLSFSPYFSIGSPFIATIRFSVVSSYLIVLLASALHFLFRSVSSTSSPFMPTL